MIWILIDLLDEDTRIFRLEALEGHEGYSKSQYLDDRHRVVILHLGLAEELAL